jgi:hypothetical protein
MYQHYNYSGETRTYCLDEGKSNQVFSMVGDMMADGQTIEDHYSGFRCGKNVKYQMCEDYEADLVDTPEKEKAYRCDVYKSNNGAGRAGGDRMKPNDKMSALTLQPYNEDETPAINFFSNEKCWNRFGVAFEGQGDVYYQLNWNVAKEPPRAIMATANAKVTIDYVNSEGE